MTANRLYQNISHALYRWTLGFLRYLGFLHLLKDKLDCIISYYIVLAKHIVTLSSDLPCLHVCICALLGRPEPVMFFLFLGRAERSVPGGLLFYRRCFFSLDSQISEVPRSIAAKLCHMIAIWRQSPAKEAQLGKKF